MKYALILVLLCLTSPALAADKTCEKPRATAVVDGMVCDFCAQGLTKVLMKEKGVTGVEVDLTTKEVKILLEPGATISDETINKKVDWAGYKVRGITHACEKS